MQRYTIYLILIVLFVYFKNTSGATNRTIKPGSAAFTGLISKGLPDKFVEEINLKLHSQITSKSGWVIIDHFVSNDILSKSNGNMACSGIACAILNGQNLGVDFIIYGTVQSEGTSVIAIDIQVLNVSSGRPVSSISRMFGGKNSAFIKKELPDIAQSITSDLHKVYNPFVSTGLKRKSVSEANKTKRKKITEFNDLRGYVSYTGSKDTLDKGKKERLAFGYLTISSNMDADDMRRYSYQLQSYLSIASVHDILYIDEMMALMNLEEGQLECRDPESAVEIGRLFGTDFMGFGKIYKLGNFFLIKTGIVNVENGKVIQNTKKIYYGKENVFLTEIIPDLALQINKTMPENSDIAIRAPAVSNQAFTTSFQYSISECKEIYELPHDKKHVATRKPFPMVGVEIGKSFSFGNRWGLFLPLVYNYGFTEKLNPDLIMLNNGIKAELVLKRNYYQLGVSPQFQFSIPFNNDKAIFLLRAGGGANYVSFNEEEYKKDAPDTLVKDKYLEHGKTVSMSLDFGTSIDFMLTNRIGIAISYGFKWWQPVNYKTSRDLFPQSAVSYKEQFMTHSAGIHFLMR